MHYVSLKLRAFDKDGNHLAIIRVDFRSTFHSESMRCSHEHRNSSNSNFSVQLRNVQDKCQNFFCSSSHKLNRNCLLTKTFFSGVSILKPSKVLSHVNKLTFEQFPFRNLLPEQGIDEIEQQYRKILLQPWNEEEVFQSGVSNNPVQFWLQFVVLKTLLAFVHTKIWLHMLRHSLVLLALVERVFSHVNAVKTDKRNRRELKMVESTRIRTTLVVKNKCCQDFVVTREMLHRFNSGMYETLVVKNKCCKDFDTKKMSYIHTRIESRKNW